MLLEPSGSWTCGPQTTKALSRGLVEHPESRLRAGLGGIAAHFGPCVGAPDPLTSPLARDDLSQLGHRGWEVLREKKGRRTWIQWCILGNKVKMR